MLLKRERECVCVYRKSRCYWCVCVCMHVFFFSKYNETRVRSVFGFGLTYVCFYLFRETTVVYN